MLKLLLLLPNRFTKIITPSLVLLVPNHPMIILWTSVCLFFFSCFSFLSDFFFFADKPASSTSKIDASLAPMSQPEFDTIRRARDTISNTVIVDLINEDADSSETSYRNSLRHQILDGCASLRVNLISIDRLMECFNKSITIACNSTSSSGSAGSQVD